MRLLRCTRGWCSAARRRKPDRGPSRQRIRGSGRRQQGQIPQLSPLLINWPALTRKTNALFLPKAAYEAREKLRRKKKHRRISNVVKLRLSLRVGVKGKERLKCCWLAYIYIMSDSNLRAACSVVRLTDCRRQRESARALPQEVTEQVTWTGSGEWLP